MNINYIPIKHHSINRLKFINRKLIHVINSNNYQVIIVMYISSQKSFLTIIIKKRKSIKKLN